MPIPKAKMVSPSNLVLIFCIYKLVRFTLPKIWPPRNKNVQVPSINNPTPASSSSPRSSKYDVFLSFRGEDTGKTFVDDFYSALVDRKVNVYKDDETLPRGESIGAALFGAIENSRIAVVIFSKNYAGSSWCLKELAYIMKCRNERGLFVMPIFYDVDPLEVRKRKGDFGKAFAKQEVENPTEADSWRKALVDACSISGWVPEDINNREASAINDMVDTILNKLVTMSSFSFVDEDLVGMRDRVQHLKSLLDIGSGGVRMVGIWGLGGSGKTTFASALYVRISHYFEGSVFVENVREKSSNHGLNKLQEKIISAFSKRKVKVKDVEEGRNMIKDILHRTNVLIVLDDVDKLDQLEALAGKHYWFGSGSRIIFTTRDEHLLRVHKVDHVYPVKLLSNDEAFELFNRHAFGQKVPKEGYETLSSNVVSYAAGLPLAIKVLGSFLYDKGLLEWRSALSKLKHIPELEVIEKIKISYDGLQTVEKELFLDIACFWRYRSIDDAMEIFTAFNYYPEIGIKVLMQKALITIVDGRFTMHDLIQEMGHNVVRGEHPSKPEKHSRLWKNEEIRNLCLGDLTMENREIEAIKYHGHGHSSHFYKIVPNLKRLRWLSVALDNDGDEDTEGPDFLSSELRCMYLEKYPKSPFPCSFQPVKLVVLELSKSDQTELWKGYKHLPSLRVLHLEEMKNLLRTPDFEGLPHLEKLTLSYCDDLEEIHPSLGYHTSLKYVTISRCPKLRLFPTIFHLEELKALKIEFCDAILKFPEMRSKMKRLEEFSLQKVGIKVLPPSIGELSSLRVLNLSENAFTRIDFSLSQLTQLKFLNLSKCKKLLDLPELPPNLTTLKADYCNSLRTVGDFNRKCKWLSQVSFRGGRILNDGDIILQSMLQGKAIENHSMQLQLQGLEIAKGFTPRLLNGSRFTLQLPNNWCNEFCGFLMCAVWTKNCYWSSSVRISMKRVLDSQHDVLWEQSDSTSASKSTLVWYVSFGSLKDTKWWDKSHKTFKSILFDLEDKHKECRGFGVRLVGKKGESDMSETSPAIYGDTSNYTHNFKIEGDSASALTIVLKCLVTTD